MFYRTILLSFFVACVHAGTITCPTVEAVKSRQFNGWLPLYIDNEELARETDIVQFIKDTNQFFAAKWRSDYLECGHCFYAGNRMTSMMILAHDAWRPADNLDWQWILLNQSAECYAQLPQQCPFIL